MASKRVKAVETDIEQLSHEPGAEDTIGGVKPSKPGKLPVPKPTHFHIGADSLRLKQNEIQNRHQDRQKTIATQPSDITNEVLYQMLSDILENQLILEARLQALTHRK